MTLAGIILVLLSACCHATWNLLSKHDGDPISFFTKTLGYSALIYLPLFVAMQFWVEYTPTYLLCVLASGSVIGVYFFALGKAYSYGHMSVAYPIARSFPILVVTWAGLFFGVTPSSLGVLGILLVVSGCFFLPMRRFTLGADGFTFANFANRSCLWAFFTALLTSIYSMIDKHAASASTDAVGAAVILGKVNYVYLQNATAGLVVFLITRVKGLPLGPVRKRRAIPAALIFLISYALIMLALSNNPVAYVVSFRQLSIVITAIISMTYLERDFSIPRLIGALIIFSGVIVIGFA